MAFDTYELSKYDGAPVELLLFKDDVAQWQRGFTTGEDRLIDGLLVYEPGVIGRNEIKQGGSEITGGLQIKVPYESEVAQKFKTYLPSRPISVTLHRYHYNDITQEKVALFVGQITTTAFENDGMVTLNGQPMTKALSRKVPWQLQQGGCIRALYEFGCGVSRASFDTAAGGYSLIGDTVVSTAFAAHPDGWYNNGYIEVPATGERRFIIGHTGSTLIVDYPFFGLAPGEPLTAYAGCDRSLGTCRDKFNNVPNRLGLDWIPTENPYDITLGTAGAGSGGGGGGGSSGPLNPAVLAMINRSNAFRAKFLGGG